MLPSYSMLVFNKVNPNLQDGVEIIKCTFQNLKNIPVSLKSMKHVLLESVYFYKIANSNHAGSIFCSSCSIIELNKICGEETSSTYTTTDDSGCGFIKIKKGEQCNLLLTSMANCQSSYSDGISITDIEMNITSSNFTNSKSAVSTLRLMDTAKIGICADTVFTNNTSLYDRSLRDISTELMYRCIYNSQKASQCSIRFHAASANIYDTIVRGSNSGKAFERNVNEKSSCSLYRCLIEGTTHDFIVVKEKLTGSIKEFYNIINCQEYEGNLINLLSNENCQGSSVLLMMLFSFSSPNYLIKMNKNH